MISDFIIVDFTILLGLFFKQPVFPDPALASLKISKNFIDSSGFRALIELLLI